MQIADDYQPLERDDLIALLKRGRQLADYVRKNGDAKREIQKEIARIQSRINQAVPGITSPNPIEGEVSKRISDVNEAYFALIAAERIGPLDRAAAEIADRILKVISI